MALQQATRERDPSACPRATDGDPRRHAGSRARRHRTTTLLGLAVAALILGVLVYLTDRVAGIAVLLPRVDALAGRHLFGAIGQSLPSFLHPFAFSLATAAALRPGVAQRWGACATWCAVNLACEFAQHPAFKASWARALNELAGTGGVERRVMSYCLQGTFDVGDVAAVVLGALAAGALLWLVDSPMATGAVTRPAPRPLRPMRWFASAAVTALGLAGIVGSGGGAPLGLGGDCPPGEDCSAPPPAPTVTIATPYVTAQVGTSVSYATTTTRFATTTTYQWSRSDDDGTTFTPIAGATAATYSLASVNLADDGATFRVQVTGGGYVAGAVGHLAVTASPGMVFQDGEFLDADWTVTPFADANEPAPAQTSQRVLTGGNPGAYRRMVCTLPQHALSGRVLYVSRTAIYDPRQQGAVYVIDFNEDGIDLTGSPLAATQSALVLVQSGRTYVANARFDPTVNLPTSWSAAESRGSLLARDFGLIDGPACQAGESCPDFSALGQPMQLGYWRISFGTQGDVIAHGIDNWKVTVWPR